MLEPITRIRVSHEDFNVADEMAALNLLGSNAGAIVSFTGVVRGDGGVLSMQLEHYPDMTQKALEEIVRQARARFSVSDVVVIHRVGTLSLGENIVLVITTSSHRHDAYEANQYIMDWLKTEAPFWKKEITAEGGRWVDARESDETARTRWS